MRGSTKASRKKKNFGFKAKFRGCSKGSEVTTRVVPFAGINVVSREKDENRSSGALHDSIKKNVLLRHGNSLLDPC